jgi:hypothetical protein
MKIRYLSIILLCFLNCDPALRLSYVVINDTTDNLNIKYSFPQYSAKTDSSLIIALNDTVEIYRESRIGIVKYPKNYCSVIPWLEVYHNNQLIFNRESSCDSMWTAEIRKKYISSGGELTFKFIVDSTKIPK